MDTAIAYVVAVTAALAVMLPKLKARIDLSRAKHRSLAGHARISRFFARFVPYYEYEGRRFFDSDGAPPEVAALRYRGFARLSDAFKARFANTARLTAEARDALSDLQFTGAYRVPFQYSRYLQSHLDAGSFVASSDGGCVTDLDGNRFHDLTGAYGVNVFGYDFYKRCMAEGSARAASLGPVLGAYHPAVAYNVRRLREISGHEEVSFHMSGTEAVMQAVRLARYHTGRSHVVRFCGAYHGWWGDVQPGIGNPLPARETYTLAEMEEKTLRVLRRRRDIACVLVNPLQALHPNASAPGDGSLVNSARKAHFDRAAYAQWLRKLREVCTEGGIVLVFDEVFVGFRIAMGGAQEYFDVRADLVTYGKTLGGGFPVGAVCGPHRYMARFRPDRPVDVCFARGTFNSHPYVMAAMQVFLEYLDTDAGRAAYAGIDALWDARVQRFNARMSAEGLPVLAANLSSIWTVCYTQSSRYNWMLQYYLRAEGVALSWVGTGRLIFSLDYAEADFDAVLEKFVAAGHAMKDDGWWWSDAALTDRAIGRGILREIIRQKFA